MASPTDIRPPFTAETAAAKVQAAENAWNTRDPDRVALAYTEDTEWRNRATSSSTAARRCGSSCAASGRARSPSTSRSQCDGSWPADASPVTFARHAAQM